MADSNSRRVAWDVLMRVEQGAAYSHLALDAALKEARLSDADRGLTTELVYGTLTFRRALDNVLDGVVKKGVRSLDAATLQVLRLGAYQLLFLDRVPAHAAAHETVELARAVTNPGATSLVNAVMRKIAAADQTTWWSDADRERKPVRYLGDRYSLPNWLANRLIQQFGFDRAETLAAAYAGRPTLWARKVGQPGDAALRLDSLDADARNAIDHGELVIQDRGSQAIVRACPALPEGRALDACAGVGGKTLYLAERFAHVTALDPSRSKLDLLEQAAARVGVSDRVLVREGELQTATLDDGFDLVLVDAPCTGLGVIRRHPETRWTRTEADITALAALQAELIEHAAKWVTPGGFLVYSVCTWTREETSRQVERFLSGHDGFESVPLPDEFEEFRDGPYLRTFPDAHDCDGFFAAVMRREK